MKRNTLRFLTMGGLAVVLVAALAWAAVSFAGQTLAGSRWVVTQINGLPPVGSTGTPTVSFEADGQLSGHSGCNGYGGAYAVDGRSLTVSEVFGTLMACADDALNAQESAYLQALNSVAAYDLSGDTLTLKDATGAVVLVFARA